MELLLEKPGCSPAFSDFARMKRRAQLSTIAACGLLIDVDYNEDAFIHLYFLNGYFVEVTLNPVEKRVPEVVPFRQGYRIGMYLRENTVLVPKHRVSQSLNLAAYIEQLHLN